MAVKELIATHSQLYTVAYTDTVILDISYEAGYRNWSIMCKQVACTVPISFYCKRFPYVESKYTIFERLTWMLMEAVKMVCLVLMDQCLIIRSSVPILDWINMKGKALAGTPSKAKVLQWKWFLSEFLNNHKIMAMGNTPLWEEEIASALMVPCPITMPKITQAKNIGCWGTERWDNSQTNTWFTDGSSMLQSGKLHWKSAAWRPKDGQILTDQSTGRLGKMQRSMQPD
jgi:hypothetical protein